MPYHYFSSESVSEGHPDKVCDAISDSILDLYLKEDPNARVAVESLVTKNLVVLAGEKSSHAQISTETVNNTVRQTIQNIGYEQDNFHWNKVEIINRIHEQSKEIAQGLVADVIKDEGAGDQGIMFGYACNETESYMPATIHYCHRLLERLAQARKNNEIIGIQPDSKSQLTLRYQDDHIVGLETVLISTQHDASLTQADVRNIVEPIIHEVLPEQWNISQATILINPTGSFVTGGPEADTGLTGRKIIVDTYGGAAPHGGGAFSGKDSTKVDRSAAYAARHLAKNIVAAGLMDKCVIQLSYAIGMAHPLSIYINDYGTAKIDLHKIRAEIDNITDFSVHGIRERLKLNNPIYAPTSSYGHFGRVPTQDGHFSWEKLDLVDTITKHFNIS